MPLRKIKLVFQQRHQCPSVDAFYCDEEGHKAKSKTPLKDAIIFIERKFGNRSRRRYIKMIISYMRLVVSPLKKKVNLSL